MSHTHSTSRLSAWIDSLRPRTLPLALASIVTGSALAAWLHHFKPAIALLALLTAALLQILSNLANDYGDAIKGSDTETRIGPLRGMQKGLITALQMKKALYLTVCLTLFSGLTLIIIACEHPSDIIGFLLLGVMAIVAAITYTVGSKPYGYLGLGDLSVLIFFGWLSVAGSFYLQTGFFDTVILLPATACGLLATAVLNINNLRDIETDRENGKNTLAVRLGPVLARRYHLVLLIGAVLCLALFTYRHLSGWSSWLFLLALPMLTRHGFLVYSRPSAQAMKPLLEQMVKTALMINMLFALGIILNLSVVTA